MAKSETAPVQPPGLFLRIPPPVWLLISLIVAFIVHRLFVTPVIVRSLPAAVVLIVAGFAFAIWGGATFSRAGTELNPTSEANAKLVNNGPFRYTRNPMYSGVMLVSVGGAIFFGTLPFFVATVILFLFVNSVFIPFEEAKMERQYGAEFRAYKSRVHRWGIF
jgi:protein-S-isoprenylcysteine O-methyltransferase Ste14